MVALMKKQPPRAFIELKAWLQENSELLPKRLQKVAVFVLHNPDFVALNTIAAISKRCEVTPSTMIRFAKSIGYLGFTDMQSVFQESMQHISQPYSQRIHKLEDVNQQEQTVLGRFSRAALESIERLALNADEAALLEASKKLATARTIYITGQGRATPVTTYLHYTLIKMGKQAVLIDGIASSMTEKASLIQADEVLVAVSFSPYTARIREIIDVCLTQKIPVVSITDSTLSPIAVSKGFLLEVLDKEVGGIRGLSATMCLALCLAVETGKLVSKKEKVN